MGIFRSVIPITGRGFRFASTIANIGDSFGQIGTTNTTTQKLYNSVGAISFALSLSNQAISYPLANNLAVGGTTLADIKTHADAACDIADIVYVNGGTNDVGTSGTRAIADSEADMAELIATILGRGKLPVISALTPRTDADADGKQWIIDFNAWLKTQGQLFADLMSGAAPDKNKAIILDRSSLIDSNGDILPNVVGSDGVHPGAIHAYTFGKQLAQILPLFSIPKGATGAKPSGTDITTIGSFSTSRAAGFKTGSTGFTPSGSVGTGWQLLRGAATSTMTAVASLETDTDGVTWQRVQIAISAAGASSEQVLLQPNPGLTTGFAAGDVIEVGGRYKVNSHTNLVGFYPSIREGGPTSPQTAQHLDGSATVWPEAHEGLWRTPPITLQSGITSLGLSIVMACKTDTGTMSADLQFADLWVRKL